MKTETYTGTFAQNLADAIRDDANDGFPVDTVRIEYDRPGEVIKRYWGIPVKGSPTNRGDLCLNTNSGFRSFKTGRIVSLLTLA